nr:PREDICTED: membrane-associated guanylate kinase, WW and PDZ domain-containing protein 1-like isoform X2 [Bemisia tabaci]
MPKSGQDRPNTASSSSKLVNKEKIHWCNNLNTVVIAASPNRSLSFSVAGGSDNGEFVYVQDVTVGKINVINGTLKKGDIILEIEGQKIAGYTLNDTTAWLNHCTLTSEQVTLKTVPAGSITPDLCQFLNSSFQKGSVDHDLQNTIRDNLYLRTVPVTTRPPRNGEVNGIDYTFLTNEEFFQLQRNGCLLESGIYEGNHYGTPKPAKDSHLINCLGDDSNSNVKSAFGLIPGAHPSSEGKRKRNRSNVEAMASKNLDANSQPMGENDDVVGQQEKMSPPNYYHHSVTDNSDPLLMDLGPLPPKWEKAYTEKGEVYFIDHNSGTSHWLDPRLSKFQKKSLEDCSDDELPYGWERINDPLYGTYYIDHVNRQTQYENPVIQAKSAKGIGSRTNDVSNNGENGTASRKHLNNGSLTSHSDQGSVNNNSNFSVKSKSASDEPYFTLNPNELMGERIHSTLVKSLRGLGITIVGGDDSKEEFLQIKSVVPNGPAWLEGKLQTGDVLVYVNDKCVLGYTHHDMVSVFQSIAPGETVKLEVCRGYPLPFDPNDPNTEVVTTVAVSAPENNSSNAFIEQDMYLKNNLMRGNVHNNANDLSNHSVKSVPDLYASEKMLNIERPNSTDLILEEDEGKPEYLTMQIVKGAMGFGFTIADSAYGQKVKKILDRDRCENLMEGDILVDINNICVRNMCHAEVVQVLKDCNRNEEASITVQRGGPRPRKPDLKPGPYRSKTPTVDFYSSRPKEIVTSRPKTPLIDTRSRPKTPTRTDQPPTQTDMYIMENSNSHHNYSRSYSPGNELEHNENNWSNKIPGHHNDDLMSRVSPHGTYYNGYLEPSERSYCLDLPNQQAAYYNDCFKKRKETTSFENEQPLSNSDLRYVDQDMGYQNNVGINRVENHPRLHGGDFVESTITLIRQDTGFGFRIVGGTEEGSQVSIGHIVPGGAADLDGRLCTGDEIVSVDGQSVINTSHHHVVQLMAKASRVTLGIRRRICLPGQDIQYDTMNVYPYDVTVKRSENEGFGFVIISSLNKAGSTIGRIIEGSPAERCGQLHLGDHILAVNGVNIMSLHHGDIVNLIKDSGYSVTLTIGPPLDDASSTASMTASHRQEDVMEGEEQYHAVELNRGSRGFGFSIRGGREFQNMALFVLQIAENGPAALDGRLKIGDQIIEINGINTKNMTHAEAIEIIRNGGPSVRLLVRRGGRVPPIPLEDQMISGNNMLQQQPNSLMCLNMANNAY